MGWHCKHSHERWCRAHDRSQTVCVFRFRLPRYPASPCPGNLTASRRAIDDLFTINDDLYIGLALNSAKLKMGGVVVDAYPDAAFTSDRYCPWRFHQA